MKLCKNCKYYNSFDSACHHKTSIYYINPIDGFETHLHAKVARNNTCTIKAQFFEPKVTLTENIKEFFSSINKYFL